MTSRIPRPLELAPYVEGVVERLRSAGHEAFVVGGAVRDLLLGRPTQDYDVATSAEPREVQAIFGRHFALPTGIAHGTVTVVTAPGRHVEVTTYRGEGAYSDGRHPDEVFFVRTIEEDLARRDFTINALAYDPFSRVLKDPWDGQSDLAAGILRAVGDPTARFREDGLRAMRAVRFAAQLGFSLDPATERAIPEALDVVAKVAVERIASELYKLLAAPDPLTGLRLMHKTGLLHLVLPELLEGQGCAQNRFHAFDVLEHSFQTVAHVPVSDPVVRLAALLHDVAKPRKAAPRPDDPTQFTFYNHEVLGTDMAREICARLRLSSADTDRIALLVREHMFFYAPEWTDATVVRFLRRVTPERIDDLFSLRIGDVLARGHNEDPEQEIGELRERVDRALAAQAALKVTDLPISGHDVMATLGVRPGRIIGRVLEALLEEVTDDPTLNDRERLLARVPAVAARCAELPDVKTKPK